MRVVVTGAAGLVGRTVAEHLVQCGLDVVPSDRETGQRADLRSLGEVFGLLADADAVVHLGAIPVPTRYPPERVFANNAMSQFNVFEACAKLGIERVVSASSVSAYGFPFQHRWTEPLYLPLDEDHPLLPQDAYGLSKLVGEQIAAAYCRRTGWSAVCLRLSRVVDDDNLATVLAEVKSNPRGYAQGLWSYVHARDVGRACFAALTVDLSGHHPLLWTADDTVSETPTDDLLDEWFPNVPRRPRENESLIDCRRARRVLGIAPNFSWRSA